MAYWELHGKPAVVAEDEATPDEDALPALLDYPEDATADDLDDHMLEDARPADEESMDYSGDFPPEDHTADDLDDDMDYPGDLPTDDEAMSLSRSVWAVE